MNVDFSGMDEFHDLGELARLCDLEPDCILEYSRARLVRLEIAEGGYRADTRTLLRLRRVSRLRREHNLSPEATELLLELLDRLEASEAELRELRERL